MVVDKSVDLFHSVPSIFYSLKGRSYHFVLGSSEYRFPNPVVVNFIKRGRVFIRVPTYVNCFLRSRGMRHWITSRTLIGIFS